MNALQQAQEWASRAAEMRDKYEKSGALPDLGEANGCMDLAAQYAAIAQAKAAERQATAAEEMLKVAKVDAASRRRTAEALERIAAQLEADGENMPAAPFVRRAEDRGAPPYDDIALVVTAATIARGMMSKEMGDAFGGAITRVGEYTTEALRRGAWGGGGGQADNRDPGEIAKATEWLQSWGFDQQ